jgi:hypothetical protein
MGGRRRERSADTGQPPTQLDVLRGVLLVAAQNGSWMTLGELARKTEFAEASISAQLRHLRKERHGGWRVEKRRRCWEESLKAGTRERVWEYSVRA